MHLILQTEVWILYGIWIAMLLVQGFAVFDSAIRPTRGYEATGKLTKPGWVAITLGAFLIGALARPGGILGQLGLFVLASLVASLVYLTDVRPALREKSGPSRW
ncbi:MAG: DUF2516 family protein [Frankiaceae bacterium]|nr:DUF2516 family protein [Frankiaceae bacterium]